MWVDCFVFEEEQDCTKGCGSNAQLHGFEHHEISCSNPSKDKKY